MGIDNFAIFKSELKEHLHDLKDEIKYLVYKEFKNFIFKNKINSHKEFSKSFLTKAFCELSTYCYLQNFNTKLFNSKNYKLIKDYLKNSEDYFLNNNFKNVVLVSATKLSKEDDQLNKFIQNLTNDLQTNVWIRNLNWYNNEHFLKEVKFDKNVSEYEEQLYKMIKTYDKNLFNTVSENKFSHTKLNFKEDWNSFLEKNVMYSLEKFIFTPIKYDEDNYENKMEKLSELVKHDTIFIFINNVEVKSKYKTTLLNDLSFFSDIIKFECPIFAIDNNDFFSLLNPLALKNFKSYNDIFEFLKNKPQVEKENINNLKTTDTLNWYWNKIFEDEENEKEINEIFNSNYNNKKELSDLEKTVTFNDINKLSEIIFENSESESTGVLDELISELNVANNLDDKTLKSYLNKFNSFVKLFDDNKDNFELLTVNYDKEKYLKFKEMIDNKTITELFIFLDSKFNSLKETLENKKLTKHDALNSFALYMKVKNCINEIEILNFK
ncbi:hypothetical protein [Spiroplasma diminutum]|uniref:Uncharacterized protein n=1 Tax=Spiroplasma diminutum CUAS-1 TaxID=1276221 RepID=S5M238_9MOLU|nr:hypothetical protein [Spiroplasma diminutum]AGR42137.1 hypothetical protein SDIMI_v3c04330 [Spiroplasma diminutum CUAS-1]